MPKYKIGKIRKTSKGYTTQVYLGRADNGKKVVKNFYGKTESEVRKKVKEFYDNEPMDIIKETPVQSLETVMRFWLENTKRVSLKPSSYDRLENTCVHQIFPYLGWYQINLIEPETVQAFLNDRANELSASSLKKVYQALNACFELSVQRGRLERNPCKTVIIPKNLKKKSTEIYYFSPEQVEAIKREALTTFSTGKIRYRLGAAYILLLNTGMRMGEALALEWTDIDFQKRTISINKTTSQIKTRGTADTNYAVVVNDTPKTRNSVRTIAMNQGAYDALQNLYSVTGKFKYVLASENGTHVTARTFDKAFRSIQKNCGIEPQVGVHSLRHTFASILFKNNVDVKTVSAILGHSGTTITYNTYIHLIEDQKIDAMKILDTI